MDRGLFLVDRGFNFSGRLGVLNEVGGGGGGLQISAFFCDILNTEFNLEMFVILRLLNVQGVDAFYPVKTSQFRGIIILLKIRREFYKNMIIH